jgi:hypothetical protein
MNPEIKNKWVAALKSGKYQQCQGRLRNDNAFCCLGVLCDILDKDKWELRYETQYRYEDAEFVLPLTVCQQAGFYYDIEHFETVTLSDMNDSGKSFREIAQYIEENL